MDMFEKYADYSAHDFVQDDGFIQWVKTPTREQDLYWSSFLENFPLQSSALEQARLVVLNLHQASSPQVGADDAAQIWARIEESTSLVPRIIPIWQKRWMVWAASILFALCGLVAWFFVNKSIGETGVAGNTFSWQLVSGDGMEEIINNSKKVRMIRLPDESKVALKAGSRLRYKRHFSGSLREVYLVGDAFFDVKRDTEKPFIVYANDLVTKVLGTSFDVHASGSGKKVIVRVKTGRVAVFPNMRGAKDPEAAGIILRPNQQVAYSSQEGKLSRTLVEEPEVIAGQRAMLQLNFTNTPASEIFSALQRAYGVEIIYDPQLLSTCRLTSSLSGDSLFEKLDVICQAIGASYKVVDAQIIINAKQCK